MGEKNRMKRFKSLFTLVIVLSLAASVFLTGCASPAASEQSAPRKTDLTIKQTAETALAPDAKAAKPSYISIDINPSIELTLVGGVVTQAKAYNDDGAAIILSTDVTGMTPQQAVKAIVGSFASQGYITSEADDAVIVITVAGGQDGKLAESLKQNAQQSLDSLGLGGSIVSTDVADEIVQTADNSGLSVGRYLVLKQIALQQRITLDEAKEKYGALKMNELLKMIEDIDEFLEDVDKINTSIDKLTADQQQMLEQARAQFRTAMKTAQRAFLDARTQAKNTFKTARDELKKAFLAGKDNSAMKTAKLQIKDSFALAKKTATSALKQAKIKARADFVAAVESLGLSKEAIEQLLEWDIDLGFDMDLNLDFQKEPENEVKADDKQDKDREKAESKHKDGQSKGKGSKKKSVIVGDDKNAVRD